jgi:hypothetical protein
MIYISNDDNIIAHTGMHLNAANKPRVGGKHEV